MFKPSQLPITLNVFEVFGDSKTMLMGSCGTFLSKDNQV